jgi:hypothetical protein
MRTLCGIALLLAAAPISSAQTTYYKEISRLVQTKCLLCHVPGQIAPSSFPTYDDVATNSGDIALALTAKTMPPWKPVAGYGDFKNSYGLSDGDRQMFLDWISNGMAPGDPADAPDPLPVNASQWQLGTPDIALQAPQYTPPPRVADTYRCFSLPTGLDTATWINAVELLPGARQEVHHALLLLDQSGGSAALDGADGQPGYDCFGDLGLSDLTSLASAVGAVVGSWVPGARVTPLEPGIAILIPGNTRIVMQVHYHPSGRSTVDQTSVGLYIVPPDSVQHRLYNIPLANTKFKIPANASGYQVSAPFPVPFFLSGKIVTILPHMHLLGRQTSVNMTDAGGNVTPLIRIDDWDFNWQGTYQYSQQIPFLPNSTIRLQSTYDNTDQNPKNPNNPIVPVGWGEGTNDEMCIVLIGVILDNEALIKLLF